jgi:hypothetical protein
MIDPDLPAILIVTDDSSRAAELHAALEPHIALTSTPAGARAVLSNQPVALVLADFRPDGLALLADIARTQPPALRLLIAEHSDLPEIVQARAEGLVRRVVSKTARAGRVRKVVADELGAATEISKTRDSPHHGEARDLIRWTVERIARVPGLVIRELPAPGTPQMQLVVPRNERFEKLRHELQRVWPAAARPVFDDALETFTQGPLTLALLPWKREPRITLVLQGDRALLELAHRIALEEAEDLPLPETPDESTGAGQPIFEYDWIATPEYVGPDRRARPTAFLSRFTLAGRRQRVSSKIQRRSNHFVDRLTPRFWAFTGAYLILSGVDAAFTLHGVRSGSVHELNPVLRPLVLGSPAVFLGVKNLLALTGLFLLTRFQLFRAGVALMRAMLTLYLLLDVYWLWLLAA